MKTHNSIASFSASSYLRTLTFQKCNFVSASIDERLVEKQGYELMKRVIFATVGIPAVELECDFEL